MNQKRGRGRPRMFDQGDMVKFTVAMSGQQRDKVLSLGGSAWVRKAIDRAAQKKQDNQGGL